MTAPLFFFWSWPTVGVTPGVTDQSILEEIQYAVLEPPDLGQTWPSELWTLTEVVDYLNHRQNRFLRETFLLVGQTDIAASAGETRLNLPADWIRTVRVVWRGSDGTVVGLERSDSFGSDHGLSGWETTPGVPLIYMDEETPTLQIQIAPAPAVDGTLQVFYVPLAENVDGSGTGVLQLPDVHLPGLKYGILADMLKKDGRGRDVVRAEYAAMRYDLDVAATKIMMQGWA